MSSVQLSEVFRHLKLFIDSLPQEQHNEPLSAATRGFNYDLFKTLTPRCFDLYLEGTSHLKHQLLANFEGVNNSIHNKCKTFSPGDSRITIPNYHQYLRIPNIAQHQTTFRLPTNQQHLFNTLRPQPQAFDWCVWLNVLYVDRLSRLSCDPGRHHAERHSCALFEGPL